MAVDGTWNIHGNVLESNAAPDINSIKLSIPNPTREILPAMAPRVIANKPSTAFHAMVKYSRFRPRCEADARRARIVLSLTSPVYKMLSSRFAGKPFLKSI